MGRNEISAPNLQTRNLEIARERRAASVARLSLLVSHQASSRFKELMCDHANLAPENWYWDAFEELEAQGHLEPASGKAFGSDASARLSADGRLYLREESE